ncbi:hypothetical protein [Paenibacillus chitinolyticus]
MFTFETEFKTSSGKKIAAAGFFHFRMKFNDFLDGDLNWETWRRQMRITGN